MNEPEIYLELDGELYAGFESISITRNMSELCGSFSASLGAENRSFDAQFIAGAPFKIWIENDVIDYNRLMTGFIDVDDLIVSAEENTLEVSGRCLTSDLIDCSAQHKSNTWNNTKFSKIVEDICKPFSISVDSSELTVDAKISKFSLQSGESPLEAISRLSKFQGILPQTNGVGALLLTSAGSTKANDALVLGENIKTLTRSRDNSGRFSEYTCKGQRTNNGKKWTKKNTQQTAIANDYEITRYRPMSFTRERRSTDKENQIRVNWEAQDRAGRAITYTTTVRGWQQSNGDNWDINQLVDLRADTYAIELELLIVGVSKTLNSNGRLTTLTMQAKETYQKNPADKVPPTTGVWVLHYISKDVPNEKHRQSFETKQDLDQFLLKNDWWIYNDRSYYVNAGYVI